MTSRPCGQRLKAKKQRPDRFITIGNMLVITIVCQVSESTLVDSFQLKAACSVVLPVMWIWTVDPLLRWFFCRGPARFSL